METEEGTPPELIQEKHQPSSISPPSHTSTAEVTAKLRDLLARVTPDNLHAEVSTGEAVGREPW
jgi:antitoxin component of MazEF toxin-antitoxin module